MGLFDFSGLASGVMGLFNDPYTDAQKQIDKYYGKSIDRQNPFFDAGKNALANYQTSLGQMQDPQKYLASLINNYQMSPYSQFLQNQAMRGLTNSASANGLIGSSPYMQQASQMSSNIASQGLQDYLSQIFGVNSQYLNGLGSLINSGQHAADKMSDIYQGWGGRAADNAAGSTNNFLNSMGNIASFFL